jgi:hypothetical protein
MDTVFKSLRDKHNAQAVLGFIINDRSIVVDSNLCNLNTVPTDINKEHLSVINEIRNKTTGPIFRRIKF